MSERFIIITGASRGIGASLAYELNDKFSQNSTFLLIARDQAKLDQVKADMKNKMSTSSQNVIHTLSLDFSRQMKVEQVYEILNKIVNDRNSYKQLFVFYNHGTLKLSPLEKIADHVNDEFQINVTSVWVLMAAIRQMFPLNAVPNQFHVNISSLLATKVLKHFSIYNTTRSARATLFRCLAEEQPSLRVINYQPGPVYTDMQKQIYDDNPDLYESYKTDYEQGKLVKAEETVKKLIDILEKNQFENGSVIDYFD